MPKGYRKQLRGPSGPCGSNQNTGRHLVGLFERGELVEALLGPYAELYGTKGIQLSN